jgi:hypothetical protein
MLARENVPLVNLHRRLFACRAETMTFKKYFGVFEQNYFASGTVCLTSSAMKSVMYKVELSGYLRVKIGGT